jgi:hypothetical protein
MGSSSDGAERVDDVDAWLERNADILRIRDARGTESWERAKQADPEDGEFLQFIGSPAALLSLIVIILISRGKPPAYELNSALNAAGPDPS